MRREGDWWGLNAGMQKGFLNHGLYVCVYVYVRMSLSLSLSLSLSVCVCPRLLDPYLVDSLMLIVTSDVLNRFVGTSVYCPCEISKNPIPSVRQLEVPNDGGEMVS